MEILEYEKEKLKAKVATRKNISESKNGSPVSIAGKDPTTGAYIDSKYFDIKYRPSEDKKNFSLALDSNSFLFYMALADISRGEKQIVELMDKFNKMVASSKDDKELENIGKFLKETADVGGFAKTFYANSVGLLTPEYREAAIIQVREKKENNMLDEKTSEKVLNEIKNNNHKKDIEEKISNLREQYKPSVINDTDKLANLIDYYEELLNEIQLDDNLSDSEKEHYINEINPVVESLKERQAFFKEEAEVWRL